MTQLVFCSICLTAYIFSVWAKKRDSMFAMLVCISILSVAAGLRAENVGADTALYVQSFKNYFPYGWFAEEKGFRLISNALMDIFNNVGWVLLAWAFIINAFIILRLWDYRKECNFSFMVLLYILILYIFTMNGMRQAAAIALVFYATRYLEQKKYFIFIVFLIVAMSIHVTSAIGIGYLFVYLWQNASNKSKKYMLIPLAVMIGITIWFLSVYESFHITHYFSMERFNVNITFFYRVFCLVAALVLQSEGISNIKIKEVYGDSTPVVKIRLLDKETIFYLCGLLLASFGMFFSTIGRIGLYYLPFEIVFFGKTAMVGKNRYPCKLLILVFAVYSFGLELIANGNGIFPYIINLPWK